MSVAIRTAFLKYAKLDISIEGYRTNKHLADAADAVAYLSGIGIDRIASITIDGDDRAIVECFQHGPDGRPFIDGSGDVARDLVAVDLRVRRDGAA